MYGRTAGAIEGVQIKDSVDGSIFPLPKTGRGGIPRCTG
jgi:hypothetical protein